MPPAAVVEAPAADVPLAALLLPIRLAAFARGSGGAPGRPPAEPAARRHGVVVVEEARAAAVAVHDGLDVGEGGVGLAVQVAGVGLLLGLVGGP